MKKILIYFFIVALVISSTGCKAKEKLAKKVGESIVEKIVESTGDGEVDIEKDKIVVTDGEGNVSVFGETEWPTSDLAKKIPKCKGGKVTTVMETTDTILIGLIEVSKEDFAEYLTEVKDTFAENPFDMTAEGNVTYGAENSDGMSILLMYTAEDSLSISAGRTP